MLLAEIEEQENLKLEGDKLMYWKDAMDVTFEKTLEDIHSKCVNSYLDEFGVYDIKIINGINYAFDFIAREKVN